MEHLDKRLHICLGQQCNNNCLFCMEADRAGRSRRFAALDTATVKRLLAGAEDRSEILFTAGEPTLRPDLPELMATARDLGFRQVGMITNARRLSYAPYLKGLVQAGLNYVLVSIHQGFSRDEKKVMRRMKGAVENPYVTCIAHPTGRLINQRDPYAVNMPQLIELAAENDCAIEINAFPQRLDLDDVNARLAHEAGVDILINTDAHRPERLGLIEYGVAVARRAWLEAAAVVNTRPRAEMEKWLKRRRS